MNARQHNRGQSGLGPEAESDRELPRDITEFGIDDIEPNATPGFPALQDRSVAFEDPDPSPDRRADPIDAAVPWERRMAPSESDVKRSVRGLDRKSVPPDIVADPAHGAIRIEDQM